MARFRLPVVKSWCEPRMASRMELQSDARGGAMTACSKATKTCAFCASAMEESEALALLQQYCGRGEKKNLIRTSGESNGQEN
jgi:hypothetical protein